MSIKNEDGNINITIDTNSSTYKKITSIIKNIFLAIIIAVISILAYTTFFNGDSDSIKALKNKINENNVKIEQLQNERTTLKESIAEYDKKESESQAKIDSLKTKIKNSDTEFKKNELDIINSTKDTDSNINYINDKYGDK